MISRTVRTAILVSTLGFAASPALAQSNTPAGTLVSAAAFTTATGAVDIEKLKKQMRKARGLGLVTKLRLAGRVNRFTEEVYWFHKGRGGRSLQQMRARYVTLHGYIAGVLKEKNPGMHAAFVGAREALWRSYANRARFVAGVGRNVVKRLEGERRLATDFTTQ